MAIRVSFYSHIIYFYIFLTKFWWDMAFLLAKIGKYRSTRYLKYWDFGSLCHYINRKRCLFKEKDSFYLHCIKNQVKDFFSKCDQICSLLRIWSHLLKKSWMENFIFFSVVFPVVLKLLFFENKRNYAFSM